jgi:hypothetical protein
MRLPREIAGFDSASGMVVALARFLHGRDVPPLGNPAFAALRPVASVVARLPRRVRQHVYSVFSGSEGRAEEEIAGLDFDRVSAGLAALYPERRYPSVMIGSSGGALIHLCAAMRVPWLPQTLLVPVRQREISPDDPQRAAHAFDRTARALLDRNPDLVLHHMHDPNQDRLTLRRMAYFRVKRTRLGASYERFLTERLEPGGTIVIAACRQRWPVTRIGERHLFQFGATGGITPDRYHERWTAPPADEDAPEAEWGFEPELTDDIEAFARRHGYRVERLSFDDPEDLSAPVADLHRAWHRARGRPGNRLIIDSFMLLDPYWTLRTGAVPYWSVFPVQPSLRRLDEYLAGAEPYDFLHLGLFGHGVESEGYATVPQWREVLGRARVAGTFAGVSPGRYPADPLTFFRFRPALRAIRPRVPLPPPLDLAAALHLLQKTRQKG